MFPDGPALEAPRTQAVKYAGSKLKLLPHILAMSRALLAGGPAPTVFDGFSGSGRVSQAYAKSGYTVYANDTAPYSRVFNTAFLLNTRPAACYQPLIDHLNGLQPADGWFTEHYGGDEGSPESRQGDGYKRPWQKKNTRKLDAIRGEIDALNLDEVTRAVALTSLMLALDQVDNTLGHFASYLHTWSPRSYRDMKLQVPRLWINERPHAVMQGDVFEALRRLPAPARLAYFDPPYGSNNEKMPPSRIRYASYYHIWTTVCLNDRPPLFGKARRRADTSDPVAASPFEEFRRGASGKFIAIESLERLIRETPAPYVLVSYSPGGRATEAELRDVLGSYGKLLKVMKVDYKRNVMAAMTWTGAWINTVPEEKNYEYLFMLEKL
jgi:adenine-specific DNA-methyltransferase